MGVSPRKNCVLPSSPEGATLALWVPPLRDFLVSPWAYPHGYFIPPLRGSNPVGFQVLAQHQNVQAKDSTASLRNRRYPSLARQAGVKTACRTFRCEKMRLTLRLVSSLRARKSLVARCAASHSQPHCQGTAAPCPAVKRLPPGALYYTHIQR